MQLVNKLSQELKTFLTLAKAALNITFIFTRNLTLSRQVPSASLQKNGQLDGDTLEEEEESGEPFSSMCPTFNVTTLKTPSHLKMQESLRFSIKILCLVTNFVQRKCKR